ncbi:ADAM family of metalloprotease ADM-B [Xylona heveae TC161]|uniref:Disintegrin and metalloproteinase domain-containing protein B n=1 Tax=Xylona heveae (strain CBS 132557 / TC161) TaxID=1328760 RepID=A0A165A4Q4_XYLHT|nr:ADAM family of metalloprotease ADM-B [Xylona heveae TC161]KZF19946.1 ADAM family of metalloprotease ADM-B [Xylona heveae TC161]
MLLQRHLVALFLTLIVLLSLSAAHSQSRGALSRVSLVAEPRILTPSGRVHAFSSFDLTFSLYAGEYIVRLSLEPNHDIIVDGASVQYLDANGDIARTEIIDRHEHKVFKGRAWGHLVGHGWQEVGWARVVIRRDGRYPLFEGAFSIHHNHHHIQLRSNYLQTKHQLDPLLDDNNDETMIVFRDSDILPQDDLELKRSMGVGCPADELSFNLRPEHAYYSMDLKGEAGSWGSTAIGALLGKRQIDSNPSGGNSGGVNLKSTIGQTAGCPSTRKVALVGVATDCTYTGTFNSTEAARQNVITQINSASDLYEKSFNITLGLQNLTVSDSNCPGSEQKATPWNVGCSGNVTIQDRLNTFSQWRGSRNDSNAYWTLLTNCNTGSAVGLAWLGQACVSGVETSQGSSGGSESVSSANVVARTSTEWQVIAHETGHTFGAVHDCTSQTCSDSNTVNAQQCCPLSNSTCDAGERYIMNPSTGQGITQFSACSIGNICSAIGRNSVKTNCLVANKDISTISGGQCGNGIVEDGEDCDCGGTESCGNNACCDATTCKFKNNAVCDDSNEDCCQSCQFAPSTRVCRASTGVCDPEEKCTGSSANCPEDQTAPDGQSCGNKTQKLTCASGQCTSRDQQCKTVMGSYTQTNDTYACDNNGCTISCASPEFGPNVCYGLQQNFLDGTLCGGGGHCQNGQCKGSSTSKEIRSWIDDHKALVIGIAAAVGGFLLLTFLGCLWRCCSRARYRRKIPPQTHNQWIQPPMMHQPVYNANQAWHSPPPPPPPPSYHQHMSSVRYA